MIQVRDLSYQYKANNVLRFPDFTLGKGEHCLLLGESGSGKTTLLHLLGGLLKVQHGTIIINQTDLSNLSESGLDHFRRKNIGFVFQRNHLVRALTVKQNLLLSPYLAGIRQDTQRVQDLLSALGIPETLDAEISSLSQGQQQRVAIARAVLNNPAVILADEPTSALDDKNCEKVISLLRQIAEKNNITLVVATHDHRLKDHIQKTIHIRSRTTI
jgi:ABC-type lipoprotein export system ATPase subunit